MDTGADETLLPMSLAEVLEGELDQQLTSEAAGIAGDRLKIHSGDVEFPIAVDREVVAWTTTVGFVEFGSSDDEVMVLGHGGCLDEFTSTVDGEKAELELVPNRLLPSQILD